MQKNTRKHIGKKGLLVALYPNKTKDDIGMKKTTLKPPKTIKKKSIKHEKREFKLKKKGWVINFPHWRKLRSDEEETKEKKGNRSKGKRNRRKTEQKKKKKHVMV